MWLFELFLFLNSANLICQSTDISKYIRESLGIRDNESRQYVLSKNSRKNITNLSSAEFGKRNAKSYFLRRIRNYFKTSSADFYSECQAFNLTAVTCMFGACFSLKLGLTCLAFHSCRNAPMKISSDIVLKCHPLMLKISQSKFMPGISYKSS